MINEPNEQEEQTQENKNVVKQKSDVTEGVKAETL